MRGRHSLSIAHTGEFILWPSAGFREAAAPPETMGFTLVGALLVIPIILTYTAWSYYVFRGKVRSGEGYH